MLKDNFAVPLSIKRISGSWVMFPVKVAGDADMVRILRVLCRRDFRLRRTVYPVVSFGCGWCGKFLA